MQKATRCQVACSLVPLWGQVTSAPGAQPGLYAAPTIPPLQGGICGLPLTHILPWLVPIRLLRVGSLRLYCPPIRPVTAKRRPRVKKRRVDSPRTIHPNGCPRQWLTPLRSSPASRP